MKRISMLPLVAALVILASCSSTARIEKDETVNFDNYKTFAWMNDSEEKMLNDIQESNLKNAVNAELAKADWQEAKTTPDIILKHEVAVEKTIRESRDAVYSRSYTRPFYNPYTRRWVNVYYPSRFMGYETNQYQAREGTITITMIDAKTDKVIWQGWTTEDIDRNLTSKDIKAGVKSIFKKFDVAKR